MSAETDSMTPDDIEECWREIGVSGDRSCPKLDDHLHCRNCPTHAQIARKLLDRPLPPGYRDEWTQHFAGRDEKAPEGEEIDSVLIFRIGEEWLGLPAAICREIAEPRPVHSLPHRRSEAVRGIVNVRGELLICISLPALLGIGGASASRSAERIAIFPALSSPARTRGTSPSRSTRSTASTPIEPMSAARFRRRSAARRPASWRR